MMAELLPVLDVATPRHISSELSAFLNKPSDAKISIKDATKEIFKYIKDNNLRDKDNPRYFQVDATLSKLFKSHSQDGQLSSLKILSYTCHNYKKLKYKYAK